MPVNALADQVRCDRFGAALGQVEIVLTTSLPAGVTRNPNTNFRVVIEKINDGRQRFACTGLERGFIQIKSKCTAIKDKIRGRGQRHWHGGGCGARHY